MTGPHEFEVDLETCNIDKINGDNVMSLQGIEYAARMKLKLLFCNWAINLLRLMSVWMELGVFKHEIQNLSCFTIHQVQLMPI